MLRTALVAALCAALLIPAAAQAASNPWLAERVINFAHQGGEDELPSNTLFAFHEALKRGADMLEIDVGATRDGRLVVLHDNTVDRTTNGSGSITDMTLREIQRLDAAYWFVPGRGIRHDAPRSAYRYRGVRTGDRRPPRGYDRTDFRIPSLEEVLREFPDVPMNIEIKGRDGTDQAVYRRTAELLAKVLLRSGRRDFIVASFEQPAVDRFHELAPRIPVAPGIDGTAAFLLGGGSPGENVAAFQIPITFELDGQKLTVTTPETVMRAHEAGYAVHVWLSNDREDDATYRRLVRMCVDGIMAAKPGRLERVLRRMRVSGPGRPGSDPCGTRIAARQAEASGDSVTVDLRRQGRSKERRSGSVRLYDRRARLLGAGSFELDSGTDATTADVRLNRRGRAAARSDSAVRAEVRERGRVVTRRLLRLR